MDNSTAAVVVVVVVVAVGESCCFRCSPHIVVLDVVKFAAK